MTGDESMAEWRITVEILRYRPEQDAAPVVQISPAALCRPVAANTNSRSRRRGGSTRRNGKRAPSAVSPTRNIWTVAWQRRCVISPLASLSATLTASCASQRPTA